MADPVFPVEGGANPRRRQYTKQLYTFWKKHLFVKIIKCCKIMREVGTNEGSCAVMYPYEIMLGKSCDD